MRLRGVLADACSVDLTLLQKALSAARNFSPDRRRLYLNIVKSRLSFELRSRNALRAMGRTESTYNVVLQLGALCLARPPKGVLHCSYHDGNTAVSRAAKLFKVRLSRRVLEESWQDEQQFYRNVDLIFTMSEWLRRSMIADFGVSEERVLAVGAGPNLTYLNELLQAPHRPTNGQDRTVLFVGIDFERKGGPVLLEAFRRVRKEVPNAKLRIVGCWPRSQDPGVEVIGALDKRDPGQEARLRRIFEESQVFALPTLFEPFGVAFLEAMYHRLPCIGSNLCAIPEIISDGETGFLVPASDPRALADRIILLLRDPRLACQMGERGFERARTNFNWDIVVQRMLGAAAARMK
jgi:glycosyltransferase involved in cell wall biosynthesis